MKVLEIVEKLNLKIIAGENSLNKDAEGVYCCDLLSWVMSHGSSNDIWITVQVHPNIVAIAQLLDFTCIIIPESIEVEEVTINKANKENVLILQSEKSSYNIMKELSELGL